MMLCNCFYVLMEEEYVGIKNIEIYICKHTEQKINYRIRYKNYENEASQTTEVSYNLEYSKIH